MNINYEDKLKEQYKLALDFLNASRYQEERKDLNFVPAICGKSYEESVSKIMVVGRAPNGWSMPLYNQADSPKEWFDAHLSWVYQNGPKKRDSDEEHTASVSHSKFWQFIRYMLNKNVDINYDKFTDSIIWTNLFKISNKYTGNPNDKLCLSTYKNMDNILYYEIKYYQPDEIWFVTKKNKKGGHKWQDDNYVDNWLYWQLEDNDKNVKVAFEKTLDLIKENHIKAKLFYRPECRRFEEIEKGIPLEKVLRK